MRKGKNMCENEIDEVMKQIDFSFDVEGIPLPEETKRRCKLIMEGKTDVESDIRRMKRLHGYSE